MLPCAQVRTASTRRDVPLSAMEDLLRDVEMERTLAHLACGGKDLRLRLAWPLPRGEGLSLDDELFFVECEDHKFKCFIQGEGRRPADAKGVITKQHLLDAAGACAAAGPRDASLLQVACWAARGCPAVSNSPDAHRAAPHLLAPLLGALLAAAAPTSRRAAHPPRAPAEAAAAR
jgi:hypothetical protein